MKKMVILLVSILILSIFCGCTSVDNNSNNPILIMDSDNDGIPDDSDAFPDDPAASVDSDGDGYPDEWNDGKNQDDSTSSPPLELDDLDHDPDEWKDSDGDGVGDNTDVFPNDSEEWSDLDNDGVGDNSDINPYVNLSISVSITKFKVTKNIDFFRRVQIYFDITIDKETRNYNNNGRYWRTWVNEEQNVNQVSFNYDIPDNTDKQYTDIEIFMYDYNLIRDDYLINIDSKNKDKSLKLKLDNIANTISYDSIAIGPESILWIEISIAQDNTPDTRIISKTYKWKYDKKNWEVSIDIPTKTYEDYTNSSVDRAPQGQIHSSDAMARFVTSDEKVIVDLAKKLSLLAKTKNYDSIETINFILSFVQDQDICKYTEDNETKGQKEYWRFPVETLVENQGDCEDSSVLFASIMDSLGYDVALLFYTWEEDDENLGHLATGIHLDGDHGHYVKDIFGKKYFYCETTNPTFRLGMLPHDVKGDPDAIVPV